MPAHALSADHAHFECRVVIDGCEHGDGALGRKIHIPDAITLLVEDAAGDQIDQGAIGEEAVPLLGRQSVEQPIG
ncbi:hypothetical protein GCM10009105_10280 [Dokdonella soli]|uniref:Uncharacterized protein n=1 Tax=Dokdonella soli TaxID=529810 RepID=A0ABN1IDV2_9GAMM